NRPSPTIPVSAVQRNGSPRGASVEAAVPTMTEPSDDTAVAMPAIPSSPPRSSQPDSSLHLAASGAKSQITPTTVEPSAVIPLAPEDCQGSIAPSPTVPVAS